VQRVEQRPQVRVDLVVERAGQEAETLAGLTRAGAAIIRTDRAGTVVVRTDGRKVVVDDSSGDWTLPPGP